MEPPLKRPRLSFFRQPVPAADLNHARHENDLVLKSRFEAIFQKYSQDFTSVGDEVDLITGEIIVDRGHIERMETETDPGPPPLESALTVGAISGKGLLRAITTHSENYGYQKTYPRADDVLQSIETLAENAGLIDEASSGYGSEHPSRSSPAFSNSALDSSTVGHDLEHNYLEPYDSDADSLFERDHVRSPSADSLFESTDADQLLQERALQTSRSPESSDHCFTEDAEILARFGPDVGQEVLELIEQRHDAHVEPAWRIPIQLESAPRRHSTPVFASSQPSAMTTSPEPKQMRSIWAASAIQERNRSAKPPCLGPLRNESEDPLQEDFSHEGGIFDHNQCHSLASDDDETSDVEDCVLRESIMRTATQGRCPYCNVSYSGKSSVMAHWDRLIKRQAIDPLQDDPHDYSMMRKCRSKVVRRTRDVRLIVGDFRTMVELHEGAGVSFQDIAKQRILCTHKSPSRLQDVYDKHRTPPGSEAAQPCKPWTAKEEQELMRLCQTSSATITTIRRSLRRRTDLEVGNKLADMWLSHLVVTRQHSDQTESVARTNGKCQPSTLSGEDDESISIKNESEDDLLA